ncbi:thiol reductant ABC exporter subunit CydD [Bacillus massiliigorillae]|uniref:thiol reductant ABC exporter subunit CydD n=1 Tax=Bacillus massiliigorillae TaxID=1243664 RepID=UPI00039F4508|nr:thiol reductant ABC exporter subunit CydD [Bacillus massiliigorillae]
MDKSLFKLKGFKITFVLLFFISVLQGLAIIFQAKYLAITITNLFNGEKLSLQLLPIFLFSLFYLGRQFLTKVRDKKMATFASDAGSSIRQQFTKKLFKLGPNVTEIEGTGNLVTMALEGITQIETYIKLFIPKITNMVVIPVMVFAYTLLLDVKSALILLIVLPTLLFFMVILGIAAQKKADKQYETYRTLSNHFVDSLRGLETLRLLGLSKRYDRNIGDVSERYRKSTMGTLRFAFLSTFALDFFSSLAVAIVALFLGLGLINGEMMLLPALTVLILAPEYFLPIRDFGTDYHATLDGKNALQAINRIISLPEQEKQNDMSIPKWNEEASLQVSNLSLQYNESSQHSLKNLSFAWKGFGKIGIIGASGAGKSTLINVLGGFAHPTTANIQLNEVTMNGFDHQKWQEQILYIPQHPYIFNDTVAKNVAFYTPDASNEEIKAACERAGLTKVIQALPNGLEESIGESGRVLSGGQEQRIALARAFLDDTRKILLFDEPTAHLDIETEWELKQNILPLLENRLVFFATHRLHWMMEMDYIIVMNHGEIIETGKHEQLLQGNGYYKQLIQAQMHGTEEQHD